MAFINPIWEKLQEEQSAKTLGGDIDAWLKKSNQIRSTSTSGVHDQWIVRQAGPSGKRTPFKVYLVSQPIEHSPHKEDIAEKKKFYELVKQWRRETIATASPTKKIMNPNYLKILRLRCDVVPLIIRELAQRPDDWFFLLEILTEHDPVKPEDKSDLKRVTQAWLDWGQRRGYL